MWRAASSDLPAGARGPRGLAVAADPEPRVLFAVQLGEGEPGRAAPEGVPVAAAEGIVLWEPGRSALAQLAGPFDAVSPPVACALGSETLVAFAAHEGRRSTLELVRLGRAGAVRLEAVDLPGVAGAAALCGIGRGRALLAVETRLEGGVAVLGLRLDRAGVLGGPSPLSPPGGVHLDPALCWDGRSAWLAWTGGPRGARARVLLRTVEPLGPVRDLSGAPRASVGAPALASARPGVLWAAWHTDRRPGRGPDLTRWVEVRRIRGRSLERLRIPPPAAGWGEAGEDQGLEFPTLVAWPAGGLTLLARSSHRLRRFDLRSDRWDGPLPVDREGWGCRARRTPAVLVGGEGLLVARREGSELVASILPPPSARGVPAAAAVSPDLARRRFRDAGRSPRRRVRLHGFQVLFGDIHQHTAHSDGLGTAREAYERARDHYGDELAAVTDHEAFLGKAVGPGEWRALMRECELADEPGRFVTLPGYEWTGRKHPGPGHKCVYLPSADLPLLGRDHPAAATSSDLIRSVGRLGGLVFPHHVGWTGADAAAHDPEVQTCWEIVSCHGAYEAAGEGPIGQRDLPLAGQHVRDQLEAGLRFGLVGGSDGHGLLWHHGVSRRRDSHRTGLTAVLVEDVCREAVFAALRARRCYATSGDRALLWLAVEGAVMGGEARVGPGAIARCRAECGGPIARAELVLRGGVRLELAPRGSGLSAAARLPALPEDGWSYLYLRVEHSGGEVAWSSPIWLVRAS